MKIVTTSITKPPKICIFGSPGAGKSRLAASFPKPFFIRTEDRHDHLSVQTHEGICDTYEKLVEILDFLIHEDHDFKTVVLDTADSAERLIHQKVCEGSGTTNILHPKIFPFYLGMVNAGFLWELEILSRLRTLNEDKKMLPVIISHVVTTHIEHPQYGSYPKFVLGVDKRAAAKIYKFCDIVGFLDWKTTAVGDTDKLRLNSSNQRVLRLKPRAFWETKESYNLPDAIDIPEDAPNELNGWPTLKAAIKLGLSQRVVGDMADIKVERDVQRLTPEELKKAAAKPMYALTQKELDALSDQPKQQLEN